MTKIILCGCNGFMGKVVSEICADDPGTEIVAGVDINTAEPFGYPVYSTIDACDVAADCIIDFSHISCVDSVIGYSVKTKTPLVLCTTGLSEEQIAAAHEAAKTTAVLKSANMSLGINTLLELLKKAAQVFAPAGFDIEIIEKHHTRKLDAPSGTALALADAANEALNNEYHYVYDRSQRHQKRDPKEIGISAIRGGNIVGEHDVIFAGMDETITFSHQATSRAVFGKGAVEAAKFLKDAAPGFYNMGDVIRAM